jgi:glycosyltransferase involved in cell wall biosynthesis
VLEGLGRPYELIFVDDGSRDGSFQLIEKLHRADERVRALQLRRNFGKAAALAAGFREARGEVIVTLDADLQDDPAELPRLVARLEDGADLISGWKRDRQDPRSKTLPSRLFNWVTGWLTGVQLRDFNSGFKAYRREVVEEIRLYGELHRFIPALAAWRGFRVDEIAVNHRPRRFGRSKYGSARFWRGCLDLLTVLFLTRYTRRPLHLFGGLGLVAWIVGLGVNLYLTGLWLTGARPIGTRPLLAFGILSMLVGIQFFSVGLLSELVLSYQTRAAADVSIRSRLD